MKRICRLWKTVAVEDFFSNSKGGLAGEYVSSVKYENTRKELMFKVAVANMFLEMNSG